MNDQTMQISDNIVEYEVENFITIKREAIVNGDPRLNQWPKPVMADYPLGGASELNPAIRRGSNPVV